MKKVLTALAPLTIMGLLGVCALMQSTERKIKQESGKGLYAPNLTYYHPNRLIRTDTPEGEMLQLDAVFAQIDKQCLVNGKLVVQASSPAASPAATPAPKPGKSPGQKVVLASLD